MSRCNLLAIAHPGIFVLLLNCINGHFWIT